MSILPPTPALKSAATVLLLVLSLICFLYSARNQKSKTAGLSAARDPMSAKLPLDAPEGALAPYDSPTIRQMRASLEGREAICIEKGAIRVRVSNIRGWMMRGPASLGGGRVWETSTDGQPGQYPVVTAQLDEIVSPGLGCLLFSRSEGEPPLSWKISAGYLSGFSAQSWDMGYGGWSLYFHPVLLQKALDVATGFVDVTDPRQSIQCYNAILQVLQGRDAPMERTQPLFPELNAER